MQRAEQAAERGRRDRGRSARARARLAREAGQRRRSPARGAAHATKRSSWKASVEERRQRAGGRAGERADRVAARARRALARARRERASGGSCGIQSPPGRRAGVRERLRRAARRSASPSSRSSRCSALLPSAPASMAARSARPPSAHRERVAGALGQLVRLVDHEDRLAQLRGIAQLGQRDRRIDRVVEVAHRDGRLARGVELELVGAGRRASAPSAKTASGSASPRASKQRVDEIAARRASPRSRAALAQIDSWQSRSPRVHMRRLRAQPRREAQPPGRERRSVSTTRCCWSVLAVSTTSRRPVASAKRSAGVRTAAVLPLPVAASSSSSSRSRERALDARHDLGLAGPQGVGRGSGSLRRRPAGRAQRALRVRARRAWRRARRAARARPPPARASTGSRTGAAPPRKTSSARTGAARACARACARRARPGAASARRPAVAPRRRRLQLLDPPARPPPARTPSARPRSVTVPAAVREASRGARPRPRSSASSPRGLPLVLGVERLAEPGAVRAAARAEAGPAVRPEQQLGDSDLERAGGSGRRASGGPP